MATVPRIMFSLLVSNDDRLVDESLVYDDDGNGVDARIQGVVNAPETTAIRVP